MADSGPIAERVLRAGLSLNAVVAVGGAANAGEALARSSVGRCQAVEADFLVPDKTDFVACERRLRIERRLRRINGRAELLAGCEGRVPLEVLFGAGRRHRNRAARAARGQVARGFESFACKSAGCLALDRLERFVAALPRAVVRAKGLASAGGSPFDCLFNFACGRYRLNWVKLPPRRLGSEAVFFGRGIERPRPWIKGALTRCRAG